MHKCRRGTGALRERSLSIQGRADRRWRRRSNPLALGAEAAVTTLSPMAPTRSRSWAAPRRRGGWGGSGWRVHSGVAGGTTAGRRCGCQPGASPPPRPAEAAAACGVGRLPSGGGTPLMGAPRRQPGECAVHLGHLWDGCDANRGNGGRRHDVGTSGTAASAAAAAVREEGQPKTTELSRGRPQRGCPRGLIHAQSGCCLEGFLARGPPRRTGFRGQSVVQ